SATARAASATAQVSTRAHACASLRARGDVDAAQLAARGAHHFGQRQHATSGPSTTGELTEEASRDPSRGT
ncbi:MAG TPA: hypothetical protein VFG86_16865, partial [Chloroflexota bacterium]|nr:hypothetical protein [Chloroflexota bacterium]